MMFSDNMRLSYMIHLNEMLIYEATTQTRLLHMMEHKTMLPYMMELPKLRRAKKMSQDETS